MESLACELPRAAFRAAWRMMVACRDECSPDTIVPFSRSALDAGRLAIFVRHLHLSSNYFLHFYLFYAIILPLKNLAVPTY